MQQVTHVSVLLKSFFFQSEMLNYYINQGIPLNKLLMGIPIYGRSWTLSDMKQHSLHSAAVDKGEPGPFRGFRGIYLYPDVSIVFCFVLLLYLFNCLKI